MKIQIIPTGTQLVDFIYFLSYIFWVIIIWATHNLKHSSN
jgi:hypothetical protein